MPVAAPLKVSTEARSELEPMARSSSLPHRQVRQAKALLRAGDGVANLENARQSEVTVVTTDRLAYRREAIRFSRMLAESSERVQLFSPN
jgi:hypothetical protein